MYELFDFKKRDIRIQGYNFPCENPNHVVCLIHGIGEYAGRYERMADYFNKAGIAVISMDLRGHGKTQGVRGHCAPRKEVLKDIDALIEYAEEFYPGVPIVMYGHSMGGNITLDYKARGEKNDVPRGYVISAPWIRLVRPIKGALYIAAKIASKKNPEMMITAGCKEEDLGNPEFVRPYDEDPLVHNQITMLCAVEGVKIGRELEKGEEENNGKADNLPCLVMHGDADKICDINGTREYVKSHRSPMLTFVEWRGYYHEIHNGGPDGRTGEEVINRAIKFITSIF